MEEGGEATAAAVPTATAASKDDPSKMDNQLQLVLKAVGDDSNTGDGSDAAAAPTSSDVPEESRNRPRNLQNTNLLSRQVLSLVPNITIPEKVSFK